MRTVTADQSAPSNNSAPMMANPPDKLPVVTLTLPISTGAAKPPRLPTEAMMAMPTAVADGAQHEGAAEVPAAFLRPVRIAAEQDPGDAADQIGNDHQQPDLGGRFDPCTAEQRRHPERNPVAAADQQKIDPGAVPAPEIRQAVAQRRLRRLDDAKAGDEFLTFVSAEPMRLFRPVGEQHEDRPAHQHGWQAGDDHQPLPARKPAGAAMKTAIMRPRCDSGNQ